MRGITIIIVVAERLCPVAVVVVVAADFLMTVPSAATIMMIPLKLKMKSALENGKFL